INRNNLPVRENEADKEFEPVLKDISVLDGKINEISNFVNNLLRDNYDIEFNNADKNDSIRKSLLNLRDKLKENIEINKKRLEEEKKRQWFAEGQAKFNDILREAGSGIKNLSETALINMVKFLNAAQGGFFIVNDNETKPFLELISAFAYDRIKMLTKRIEFGEGLVGMCALEKNTIVVTDVPEDYMQIESGLGEAAPDNILIIPLKTEDKLLGVIEIASFYDFKKEEIEFIENVAENIAATLEAVKISHKTSELLQETRKKSEELALRDSEMSEKISELRDAQKETKRSESEMTALVSVINRVLFKMELTASGKIISVNNLFLRHLGYSLADIKNKNFTEFIKNKDKKLTEDIYKKIAEYNFTEKEITFISKENTEIKTASFFSSVINEKGEISRILMLADNISYREDLQKKNNLLKEELQAKIKIITEKEKEINGMFNKIKENSFDEKSKQRQKEILKEYETPVDKKYTLWLKDLISKK
ncbi:MAG: GAF domain-containing protein, partial [Chlorobi bacterium]|nr:GAF domain-containing protein [Chlorobiota bacterium]